MPARRKPRPTILDTTDISAVPDIAEVWRVTKKKVEHLKPSKTTVTLGVPMGLAYLAGHLAKTHGMSRNRFLATLLNEDLYDAFLRVEGHFNSPKKDRRGKQQHSSIPGDDDAIPFDE